MAKKTRRLRRLIPKSAWALHVLRQQPDFEVVGLLTTFNEEVI